MLDRLFLPQKKLDWSSQKDLRVLLYCSSDFGLGHFSRLNRIARRLRELEEKVQILFITDILPQPSQDYHDHFGVIQLPGYVHSEKRSKRSGLKLEHQHLLQLRVNIISSVLWSFEPQVMLMDTGPHGKKNELAKPLAWLASRRPKTKRVLQFRDIPIPVAEYEDPENPYKRKILAEHHLYHRILVSGHPKLFNVAQEYKWPKELEEKLHYCGLVVPRVECPPKDEGDTTKRLLISFGGGWESEKLVPVLVKELPKVVEQMKGAPFQVRVFTGPSITQEDFALLETFARQHQHPGKFELVVERYNPDFPAILAQSDAAFLQAGSTAYQVLDSAMPLILYTREYSTQEQQERARILSAFPDVTVINGEWLQQNSLGTLLTKVLLQPKNVRETGLTYNGVDEAARMLLSLAQE